MLRNLLLESQVTPDMVSRVEYLMESIGGMTSSDDLCRAHVNEAKSLMKEIEELAVQQSCYPQTSDAVSMSGEEINMINIYHKWFEDLMAS